MKILSQHRLKINIFCLMISAVLILLVIVGVPMNRALTRISKERLQSSYQQLITERAKIMSGTTDNIFKLCDEIIVNDEIYNALCNYDILSNGELLLIHKDIAQFISSKYYFMKSIKTISIVTKKGKVLYDTGFNTFTVKYVKGVTNRTSGKKGKMLWTYASGKGNKTYIIASKAIHYRFQHDTVGYIILSVEEPDFKALFSDLYIGENSFLAVADSNNRVISSTDNQYHAGDKLSFLPGISSDVWQEKKYFTVSYQNNYPTIAFSEIGKTDWKLIGMVDYQYLNTESNVFQKVLLIAGGIALILCILIVTILFYNMFKPMDLLIKHMSFTGSANLEKFKCPEKSGEIATLSEAYNSLIDRINTLINEIKENEVKKHKMELQLLHARINPHFLFNTLDSLKWVSLMSQCDNVADGISALSDLLRSSISGDLYSTVADDMYSIKNYVTIMTIRYNEFFDFNITVEEEVKEAYILKMLIQPIIENSIIHGIANLDYKGKIQIYAFSKEGNLRIMVEDNGRGFCYSSKDSFTKKEKGDKLNHIGMKNVSDRIKLYYGEKYGYQVLSGIGKGTKVVFNLPLIYDLPDD